MAAIFVVAALAAIAGDNTAYFIGRTIGPRLFHKEDGIIFRKEHIDQAQRFYERYGSKTLLAAHFIAVVRTFSPLVAGVADMSYKRFFIFDAIGDSAWAVSVTLVGYFVGSRIPNVDNYILIVLFVVIVASVSPTLYHVIRVILKRHRAKKK